mmetsp:Transcript_34114/g.78760  ORF Transcript_34114/g.78760 Transcript_34114/m.78760 type:complete len:316 (+) Transcript_34114:72-1019(+)
MDLGILYYVKEAIYKAEKALVAAKFTGAKMTLKNFDPAKDAKKPDFLSKNPSGKVPYLETEFGVLFSSNSIARYVAKSRADTGLLGSNFEEEGEVETWLEFGLHEVEIPLFTWAYPVMGMMEDAPAATKDAQADVKKALAVLEDALRKSPFLVGNDVTLADICLVCCLKEGFKHVLDPSFVKAFPKTCEWFDRCRQMPQFKTVFGEVKKCTKAGTPQTLKEAFKPPSREVAVKTPKAEPKVTAEKPKAEPKANTAAPAPAAVPNGESSDAVTAVGNTIRELKLKLKSDGLSGKAINEHPEVKELVAKLQALKAAG